MLLWQEILLLIQLIGTIDYYRRGLFFSILCFVKTIHMITDIHN